jgi:hypothetical protein
MAGKSWIEDLESDCLAACNVPRKKDPAHTAIREGSHDIVLTKAGHGSTSSASEVPRHVSSDITMMRELRRQKTETRVAVSIRDRGETSSILTS